MDLHRFKVELTNAITHEFAKAKESDERMMNMYAVQCMESGSQEDRDQYNSYKDRVQTTQRMIDIAQSTGSKFKSQAETDKDKS
jgi:hypothetical protein